MGRNPDFEITELPGIVIPERSATLQCRIDQGNYDSYDEAITTQKLPGLTLCPGPCNLVLLHFTAFMVSDDVVIWADQNKYKLARLYHLLALGSHPEYKDLQRNFPIIQLGTSTLVGSSLYTPSLGGDYEERRLCLDYYWSHWLASSRFLLVRK